ncbi:asparagine synthase [Planococcus maritimus]|uniref:asparagine synthase (glutamine-hydrolyzing) n=1 Tax=Planococcus maritimus TaxID=192421 RepID=A0A7D7QZF1_PLAMR|nr:asparagine synthase C-terminal domain-containing protein [Planococcus maritimus]QMT16756.1 asparagine synthase [Planococcus maritimus]
MKFNNHSGFNWTSENGIYVKGYMYLEEKYVKNIDVINCLKFIDNYRDFHSFVKKINGSFCIIIHKPCGTWAAVDRARSFPLYYSTETFEVTDAVETFLEENNANKGFDDLAIAELMSSGFIQNNRTTIGSIKQILAGETIEIADERISRNFYFKHTHNNKSYENNLQVVAKLKEVSNNIFDRLINSLEGKTAIIPLSGGYDSRFIASMLKNKGFTNVICYTYGQEGSYEVEVSKKVAETLGFQWYFVKYDENVWEQLLSEDCLLYAENMHNYSGIPHFQDYPALKELTKKNIIPKNSVIVNGFCGDLPAGSFVLAEVDEFNIEYNLEWLVQFIFKHHYQFLEVPESYEESIKEQIKDFLLLMNEKVIDFESFTSLYEAWFTNSRPIQWVVNSNRVYEHFGLEWRMPLWDLEFINFFYSLETKYRRDSLIYYEFLFSEVFNTPGLDTRKPEITIAKPIKYSSSLKGRLRKKAYVLLVKISFFTGWTSWNYFDVNNYSKAALILYKDMNSKKLVNKKSLNFHQVNALWWSERKYGVKKTKRIIYETS